MKKVKMLTAMRESMARKASSAMAGMIDYKYFILFYFWGKIIFILNRGS
jgi:hypothetical protein